MFGRVFSGVAVLVLVVGCGAKQGEGQGHGHGHGHDDPEALRTLMGRLLVDMVQVRGALAGGELTTAAKHASAIAKACEHSGPPPTDVKAYGERFADLDRALHGGAARLAAQAEAGDAAGARKTFGEVVTTCNGCHAQAPLAMEVDLSALQAPF